MHRRTFITSSLAASLALTSQAQQKTTPLTVAIIGHTGRGNYGHDLDNLWLNVPEVQIVAVSDPDPKGLASALQRLKVDRGFSSYQEMLAAVKPDLVSIGPRHIDQHRDMTLAAAAAGVKGIYMEKPFCRTPQEADEILKACKEGNVKLALAHRNRYHPALPQVKKLLEDGTIGRLLEVRCRGKEDQRGGGLDLWVLGSHVLNLAVFFTGPATECSATYLINGKIATRENVFTGTEGVGPLLGNELHATYLTAAGIPIHFDSIQNAGEKNAGFGLQLVGSKGIIDLRIDEEPLAHLLPGNPFDPVSTPRQWTPITSAGLNNVEPLKDIRKMVGGHMGAVQDLLAAIKENRPPLCSAEEGAATVEMICATFASHVEGGKRVNLPLQSRTHPLA